MNNTGPRATGAIPDARAMALEMADLRRQLRWQAARSLPTLDKTEWPQVPDVPPFIFMTLVADAGMAGELPASIATVGVSE